MSPEGRNGVAIAEAIIVRKTANETVNNSAVLQDDDHFSLAVSANEIWVVEFSLVVDTATAGFKIGWTLPAGTIITQVGNSFMDTTIQTAEGVVSTLTLEQTEIKSARLVALIVVGGISGTAQFQWAQRVATAEDTIMRSGSLMIAHRL